jgi:glycosyltransferase 2 family protein
MKKYIQAAVGAVIGAGLIWLLFRDTNWQEVGEAIRNVRWGWIAIGHIPLMATFLFRIIRWKYIVQAVEPTPLRKLASATQIGFLANFTLPGRAGEAIRALVLTRLTRIPFAKSFALVALDRVTDLFGLIAVMLVAIFAFQPTQDVVIPPETFGTANPITFAPDLYRNGAVGTGVFLVVIIGAFVLLYINKNLAIRIAGGILGPISQKLSKLVTGMMENFAEGLHVFRSPVDMFKTIFFSLVTWGCSILLFYATLEAFSMDYPWYTPFVVQAILSVFIAAPGAPGFVGQYHVPVVICLLMVMPTLNVNDAKAYAIVSHLIQLPPIFLLGLYFLITDDFGLGSLGTLASEGQKLSHESDEGEAP